MRIDGWLPPGKNAAICLSLDDVHPGTSRDFYEAGGDCENGVLRHLESLLYKHPQLRATLFITPDWRVISPIVSRKILSAIPFLRDFFFLTPVRPPGAVALRPNSPFVSYIRDLPRTDTALHGLHHIRRGMRVCSEFEGLGRKQCFRRLSVAISHFQRSGLPFSPGLCPPCWTYSDSLAAAMRDHGLSFISSARDIRTPIAVNALTGMSGVNGLSLIYPQIIQPHKLVHISVNFQATSQIRRAMEIIDANGLLSIKAHAAKYLGEHEMLDALDERYTKYLDTLFTALANKYGDSIWWTTMSEIADRTLRLF